MWPPPPPSPVSGSTSKLCRKAVPTSAAITAAMKYGTEILQYLYRHFPEIVAGHGTTARGDLCCRIGQPGNAPVVAIYSTFLQRAYTQMIYYAIRRTGCGVCCGRAGLVPAMAKLIRAFIILPFISPGPLNYAELTRLLELRHGPWCHFDTHEAVNRSCLRRGAARCICFGKPCGKTAIVTYGTLAPPGF